MSIFSRFRDILASNINSMLDKAEDPAKLIRLMIQEMEDTLVEMKAGCAGALAARTRVEGALEEARERAAGWESKAVLALDRGREDLAREALQEKRRFQDEVEVLERDHIRLSESIGNSLGDISRLEEKLAGARQKQQSLLSRYEANRARRARGGITEESHPDPFTRFEAFEKKVKSMEGGEEGAGSAVADPLEEAFRRLETDDRVEQELNRLKARVQSQRNSPA